MNTDVICVLRYWLAFHAIITLNSLRCLDTSMNELGYFKISFKQTFSFVWWVGEGEGGGMIQKIIIIQT